jgi:hypothetical protein
MLERPNVDTIKKELRKQRSIEKVPNPEYEFHLKLKSEPVEAVEMI